MSTIAAEITAFSAPFDGPTMSSSLVASGASSLMLLSGSVPTWPPVVLPVSRPPTITSGPPSAESSSDPPARTATSTPAISNTATTTAAMRMPLPFPEAGGAAGGGAP